MNQTLDDYKRQLNSLSVSALASLAVDVRAQSLAGLMSSKEAHDRINVISIVLMRKQLEEMGVMSDEDYEEHLWKEKPEGGQSEGDDLMTNGWED